MVIVTTGIQHGNRLKREPASQQFRPWPLLSFAFWASFCELKEKKKKEKNRVWCFNGCGDRVLRFERKKKEKKL